MGLFDFFRRKPKLSKEQSEVMDKMAELLFGGKEQMREQIMELHKTFNKRYSAEQVANALVWMTSRFVQEGDKSARALVDEGQMRRPNNAFSKADVMTIYNYVARKRMPESMDSIFAMMNEMIGNRADGATTDVIPGAYGEYGLCVTNPIPTRGIPANEVYLRKLALLSGEPFHWERIGSFGAPNIKMPIDGYAIISDEGERLCTIYISPYQKVISNKAPKGFYIK